MISERQRALYRKYGIDPDSPNPDGSDYHIMDHLDKVDRQTSWLRWGSIVAVCMVVVIALLILVAVL